MNPEPYDIKMDTKAERLAEQECPHLRKRPIGDECFYYCELTEKPSGRIHPCTDQYGYGCETYREILEEWRDKDD